MYFGNPEKFAIGWDEIYIPENSPFRYGYISLVAGMQVLGARICHTTLGPELVRLSLALNLLRKGVVTRRAIGNSINFFQELVEAEEKREKDDAQLAVVLSPWALFDLGFYSFFLSADDGEYVLSGWAHEPSSVMQFAVSREDVIAACTLMIKSLRKNPDLDR